jgi:hypothetical protein
MTATVARVASGAPSEEFAVRIIKVKMSCTGNLDTHTIIIEDADLLRMFVVKEGDVVIEMKHLEKGIPIFTLVPAGLMPDNDGEEDTDADFEMLNEAWKICRLVWGYDAGIEELNKRLAEAMRVRRDELAAQASNGD